MWRDEGESASDATVLSEGNNLIYLVLGSPEHARELVRDVASTLELPPFTTLCIDDAVAREQSEANSNLSALFQSYQTWVEPCARVPRKLLVFHDIGRLPPPALKQALHVLLKLGQDKGSASLSQYVAVLHWNARGPEYDQLLQGPASPAKTKEMAAAALQRLLLLDADTFADFNVDALLGRVSRVSLGPPTSFAEEGEASSSSSSASSPHEESCAALGLAEHTRIGALGLDSQQCALPPLSPSAAADAAAPGSAALPVAATSPALLLLLPFLLLLLLLVAGLWLRKRRVGPAAAADSAAEAATSTPVKEPADGGDVGRSGGSGGSERGHGNKISKASPASSASSSPHAGLSRAALQTLAKQAGIKANLASAEIIRQLEKLE